MIRIYEGKTIEITETVSDSNSFSDNRPVYPFDNTKFIIAYSLVAHASDYDCVVESSPVKVFQLEGYTDENDIYHWKKQYYDLET